MNPLNLCPQTRLADILAVYPFMKEALPQIHPKFKMLHTPLGKLMMTQATVAEMSKRSGMDTDALIQAIRNSIVRHK